ncbi:hypothetical protein [Pseudalkalibacillus sp. SCS-8]|uniref:hypothetical protein n=1 Tax=Pseudalkalibacillus nanhaiensis TaxID=3115291 RepID=UPI0032DA0B5C
MLDFYSLETEMNERKKQLERISNAKQIHTGKKETYWSKLQSRLTSVLKLNLNKSVDDCECHCAC